MQSNNRTICIDVCDYTNNSLCNLYDSTRDVEGQAFEVYLHSQRNGFKELQFQLPSTCMGENGQERNYRLDYLISDYRIKVQKQKANSNDIETDWFLISESKVTHQAFSENYEIRAGHISNLLNTKRLDLEFSDNEGNNVGTIGEIAATILEGTGWHLGQVAHFYEEKKYNQSEDTEKIRSFNASVQTGAFKMISDLCELFDAKPIYHGEGTYAGYKVQGTHNGQIEIYKTNCDAHEAEMALEMAINDGWDDAEIISIGDLTGRTVDIIPMNPFSKDVEEGVVPADAVEDKVLELYYDKNVKSITRTLNTENMVTKLSAYGSYGNRNGLCSLQKATHEVLHFSNIATNKEYKFTYNDTNYYFQTDSNPGSYSNVTWSALDYMSRSYIYMDKNLGGNMPSSKTFNTTSSVWMTYSLFHADDSVEVDHYSITCNSDQIELEDNLQFDTIYTDPSLIHLEDGEYPRFKCHANTAGITASLNLHYTFKYKNHIINVYKEPKTNNPITIDPSSITSTEETNDIPFLLDFTYYRKIGLLTDEMVEAIADYQMNLPEKYRTAEQASLNMSDAITELFQTAASGGFLKLHITDAEVSDDTTDINYGQLKLTLDDIIYRSDYNESRRNRFSWNCAEGIKESGLSIGGTGSVVYIVRQSLNFPTQWTKSYVKMLGNGTNNYFYDELGNTYELHERSAHNTRSVFPSTGDTGKVYVALDTGKFYVWSGTTYLDLTPSNYIYGLNKFEEPTTITLWCAEEVFQEGDIVYLFSSDSIAGLFGPREDAIYANRESIEKSIETVTERHPLIFLDKNTETIPNPDDVVLKSYGWCYKSFMDESDPTYQFGYLYFCYGQRGDTGWSQVYISKGGEDPEINPTVTATSGYGYYYHIRKGMLYRSVEESVGEFKWEPLDSTATDDKRVISAFQAVIPGCVKQEILTKGVHETYTYSLGENETLPVGEYALVNEFGTYWLFTTDMNHTYPDVLRYDSSKKILWQDNDEHHILKAKEYMFDSLVPFPVYNEMVGITFSKGSYDDTNHTFGMDAERWMSGNIYVHDNVVYQFYLPVGTKVVCLTSSNKFNGEEEILSDAVLEYELPNNTTHIRIVCAESATDNPINMNTHYAHVKGYDSCFFAENKKYIILNPTASGETTGIYDLMDKFITLSDNIYLVQLPALQSAQNKINEANINLMNLLGDMYREGYWQQNDYVEGDESKLYSDALDNLKEISHPEATYEVDYLELYASDKNVGLSVDESTEDVHYSDVDITWAAHLVDTDIDTNKWAYIDDINTCYDQPWKSTLEVNTQLSTIGQQSFTDVLGKIAEVSNETKAKQTIYKRAEVINTSGKITTETLEGPIQTNNVVTLVGGTSNWYTDSKGNIIFEAPDGETALMVTGRGIMTAQDKDAYGDWSWLAVLTGKGINANAIKAGYISADRIEAGSITTNKISAVVGSELDISSNQALNLFATTDGTKPAGSLITSHPDQGDSWIAIGAKQGNNPAYIAIKSGGKVIIEGGSIDVTATTNLSITSGKALQIATDGTLTIGKTGQLFTIGGSTVNNVTNSYIYNGMTSLSDTTNNGIYLGTDGIALGKGTFKVTNAGVLTATSATISGSITATSGEIAGWTIGTISLTGNKVGLAKTTNDTDIAIWAGNATASSAKFKVAQNGKVTITDASIEIKSGNTTNFQVTDTGSLTAKTGQIAGWNFNSTQFTAGTGSNAVGVSTGDTAFWAGGTNSGAPFRVSKAGALTATSGTIGGWTISSDKIQITIPNSGIGGNNIFYLQGLTTEVGFTTSIIRLYNSQSFSSSLFYVNANGNMGAQKINYSELVQSSSKDVKYNINSLSYSNDIIDKLMPVSYIYKDDNKNKIRYGLIYEDTINLLPIVCGQDEEGHKYINYVELVPVLLKEIQNLRKRISKLEKE